MTEFGTVRGMGNLGGGGNIANAEAEAEASFCSSKMMDPITETETKAWDDNHQVSIASLLIRINNFFHVLFHYT